MKSCFGFRNILTKLDLGSAILFLSKASSRYTFYPHVFPDNQNNEALLTQWSTIWTILHINMPLYTALIVCWPLKWMNQKLHLFSDQFSEMGNIAFVEADVCERLTVQCSIPSSHHITSVHIWLAAAISALARLSSQASHHSHVFSGSLSLIGWLPVWAQLFSQWKAQRAWFTPS